VNRDTRIVAAALAAVAATILGTSTFCAWALSTGASERWRILFRVLCHGMAERSLIVFGEPMPICARCSGIYAGLLAGIALYALMPWLREGTTRVMLLVAVVPITIDGVTQAIGLRTSTNPLRIATGLAVAIAFAMWALSVVQHKERNAITAS
jgi:uncharacterized membrane protein